MMISISEAKEETEPFPPVAPDNQSPTDEDRQKAGELKMQANDAKSSGDLDKFCQIAYRRYTACCITAHVREKG